MVRYKNRYGVFRVRLEKDDTSLNGRDVYYAIQVKCVESFDFFITITRKRPRHEYRILLVQITEISDLELLCHHFKVSTCVFDY